MKKIIFSLLIIASSLSVRAQNLSQVNLDSLLTRELDSMTVRLGLSPEQRASIKSVQQAFYIAIRSMATDLSIEARSARLDSLGNQRDQALQAVLTEAQWTALQAYLAQRQQAVQQAIEERRNRHRQQTQNQ